MLSDTEQAAMTGERPDRTLPNAIDEPTVTVERAGDILGVSRHSAYEAARAGVIPTIKIGRRLLVPTASLLAMLGVAA